MPTLPLIQLSLALIDLRSASVLAISDLSTYTTVPSSNAVSLQITPPNGWPTISVEFTPGQVNIYKCVDLGITCGDVDCCPLPDGIYAVKYTVRPTIWPAGQPLPFIDQKFIKIDNIRCKYQRAFLKADLECECSFETQKELLQDLRKVKLYIDGSVAEANDGNYELSKKYYKKADNLLDTKLYRSLGISGSGCGCG